MSKNIDTIRRAAEDIQQIKDVTKKNQTLWRKIAPTKPKSTLQFQELSVYTKEKKIIEVKYRKF